MIPNLKKVDHKDILYSILSEYHGDHDLAVAPVKVERLRPLIEQKGIAQKIEFYEVDFASRTLAASVEIFDRGKDGVLAQVKIAQEMDFYWKRIALCKEMYHCMIDCSENLRVKTFDELMALAQGLTSRFSPSHSKQMQPAVNPLDTEAEAEFLAIETLFPFEIRQHHFAAYHQGKISPTKIAARFVIPEWYVPQVMSKSYMNDVRAMRGDKLVVLDSRAMAV
jgi:hypothetical protein